MSAAGDDDEASRRGQHQGQDRHDDTAAAGSTVAFTNPMNDDAGENEERVQNERSLKNERSHSKRGLAAGVAMSKQVRHQLQDTYTDSVHHGAAMWSSLRRDVPMYFGHQPEDGKIFTTQDHVMEVLGELMTVMLLPALGGLSPFFVPLAGANRRCIIPDAGVEDNGLLLRLNTTDANVTLPDFTIPCAEIRSMSFLFYTCPAW